MYQNFNGGWLVHLYFKTHNEARWIWSVLCSPHSRNTPQTVLQRVHRKRDGLTPKTHATLVGHS